MLFLYVIDFMENMYEKILNFSLFILTNKKYFYIMLTL